MKLMIGFIAAFSLMRMFGIEPVEKDDISVYDPPAEETVIDNNDNVTISEDKNVKSYTYSEDKGYVYGTDELHVTGTPSNSKGYTAAGYYGYLPQKGKGWVYGVDELHVTGLPVDPETGYTLPGYYGEIEK